MNDNNKNIFNNTNKKNNNNNNNNNDHDSNIAVIIIIAMIKRGKRNIFKFVTDFYYTAKGSRNDSADTYNKLQKK